MSFLNCIRSAAESGLIKPEKAKAAEAEWQAAYDDAIAQGMSEDTAAVHAGVAATDTITKLTGVKRWQKINQISKSHRLFQQINSSKNIGATLDDIMIKNEIAYNRNRGIAMQHLENLLDARRPKLGGFYRKIKGQDNLVREAYGEATGDESAAAMAEAVTKTYAYLVKRANMEGAAVPDNPNFRLPQKFDRLSVRRYSEAEFISDYEKFGDWDLIEFDGKKVPEAKRPEVLSEMYRGIITDGKNRTKAGQTTGKSNYANRLSEPRFFYYKDADSYLAAMKKYGAGGAYDQVINSIDSMSRDIALMETFGPTPQAGHNFAKRAAEARGAALEQENNAKRIAQGKEPKKSDTKKVEEALTNFDDQFKTAAGHVVGTEENLGALIVSNARTITFAPLLSSVLLSSIPDLAFVKSLSKALTGLPTQGFLRDYVKNFLKPGFETHKFGVRSGLIWESAMNMAHGFSRYHGPLEGSHFARVWSDIHYRVGLSTRHNEMIKHVYILEQMGHFADNFKKSFDELEFGPNLAAFGITPEDWDLFRSTPMHVRKGAEFLRPIDLVNRTDGNVERNIRVGEKFQDFLHNAFRMSVANPDITLRTMSGGAISGATVRGQVMKTVFGLKSFPLTVLATQLKAVHALGGGSALKTFSKLVLFTWLMGGISMQLKALANGKDLYNPLDPDYILASLAQGGSIGLAGDLVYNSLKGGSLKDQVAGPSVGAAEDAAALIVEAGKIGTNAVGLTDADTKLVKSSTKFAERYGPRTWQLKLLLDRYLYDTVLEAGDPAAFAEKQRRVRRHAMETGQDMWWAPGEDPRAPKISERRQ